MRNPHFGWIIEVGYAHTIFDAFFFFPISLSNHISPGFIPDPSDHAETAGSV
jgi:hypothetical protein